MPSLGIKWKSRQCPWSHGPHSLNLLPCFLKSGLEDIDLVPLHWNRTSLLSSAKGLEVNQTLPLFSINLLWTGHLGLPPPPPSSYFEILTPSVMALGGEVFKCKTTWMELESKRQKRDSSLSLSPFLLPYPSSPPNPSPFPFSFILCPVRTQWEDGHLQTKRVSSPDTSPWSWTFQPPELWKMFVV